MFKNNSRVTVLGTLLIVGLSATVVSSLPDNQFQGVDAQSKNQPLICDGLDRIITFSNFVTAQVWFEQIRWKKSGSYSIGMEYVTGEKVILSYQCTKT